MIVVSDTSVLINLAAIGQFDLLFRLYSSVHVAHGVLPELNGGGKPRPGDNRDYCQSKGETP